MKEGFFTNLTSFPHQFFVDFTFHTFHVTTHPFENKELEFTPGSLFLFFHSFIAPSLYFFFSSKMMFDHNKNKPGLNCSRSHCIYFKHIS